MSLAQISDTAANAPFRSRVQAAMIKAAEDIVGEDWVTAGFTVTKAKKRHAIGVQALQNGGSIITAFVNAVAADIGEVADPSTLLDADIGNSVSALWDDIAGVMHGE